ncbi:hypothetical protein [Flavimarina sp. Hel_I_48]|uniref:hypothetical protein n=1 Tax=Flavimarina sp. Hel_I_48 TaxID=1392488 RepID=UPI0004DECBF4|nr:hypothetical protein [Flavimarina sp. Hel_I_48]
MSRSCHVTSLFLFLWGFASVYGQEIRPAVFASLSGFRHTGFEDNLFTDFEIGLSAASSFWITPKISYKHSGGRLNDNIVFEEDTAPLRVKEELRTYYSANLFGIGAEIRLTKQEDFWVFFWPRYYAGNFKFHGEFLKRDNNRDLVYKEIVKDNDFESYIDFSLGFSGYIDDAEKLSASVFLSYTTMDLKGGFKSLDFEQTNLRAYESTETLGLGFMIEYKPW